MFIYTHVIVFLYSRLTWLDPQLHLLVLTWGQSVSQRTYWGNSRAEKRSQKVREGQRKVERGKREGRSGSSPHHSHWSRTYSSSGASCTFTPPGSPLLLLQASAREVHGILCQGSGTVISEKWLSGLYWGNLSVLSTEYHSKGWRRETLGLGCAQPSLPGTWHRRPDVLLAELSARESLQ